MKPLLWAAWFGHVDSIRLLVNSGADIACANKVQFLFPLLLLQRAALLVSRGIMSIKPISLSSIRVWET